jgi:biopolymer transport protein ExbB/TolQ
MAKENVRFSWYRDDLEAKLGIRGARFTRVNNLTWFVVAAIITVGFYAALSPFPDKLVVQVFTRRGPCQYLEVFFAFWALLIVLVKWTKVKVQRKALEFNDLVPPEADFVLSPATVGHVLARLRKECDDSGRFILFARIDQALSNLKNMGQVGDLDNVLQSQASNDEDVMESSYSLVKGLIWAIPVLGFIGTVQGLGGAIGAFGAVLVNTTKIEDFRTALQGVTANLSTAFDTTYVALVAALGIQLLLVLVRKGEEEMMDECKNYCQRHLVGRLRLTSFDRLG